MWRLRMRENKPPREWSDMGEFRDLSRAVRRILELEEMPGEALFLLAYIWPPEEKSDSEIMCRLQYFGAKAFYLIQQQVN
jgi:hypothetical protein